MSIEHAMHGNCETDSSPILVALNISDATFLNARYSGEWEEGLKQGQGKFIYHNGDVFTVSLPNESVM